MCHIRRFDCHMFRQQQRLAVRYYMSFWEQLTAQHVGAFCRKPFRNSFPTGKFWPYWKKWVCWQIFRLSRCSTAPGWSNAYTKVASKEPRDKCHAFCRCPSTLTAAIELSNYASRLSLYMVSMEKESCSKKSSHLAAFSAAFFSICKTPWIKCPSRSSWMHHGSSQFSEWFCGTLFMKCQQHVAYVSLVENVSKWEPQSSHAESSGMIIPFSKWWICSYVFIVYSNCPK